MDASSYALQYQDAHGRVSTWPQARVKGLGDLSPIHTISEKVMLLLVLKYGSVLSLDEDSSLAGKSLEEIVCNLDRIYQQNSFLQDRLRDMLTSSDPAWSVHKTWLINQFQMEKNFLRAVYHETISNHWETGDISSEDMVLVAQYTMRYMSVDPTSTDRAVGPVTISYMECDENTGNPTGSIKTKIIDLQIFWDRINLGPNYPGDAYWQTYHGSSSRFLERIHAFF